jgi:hypothetical protein
MDRKIIIICAGAFAMVVFTILGCVEPYSPEIINEDVSLLVVDGFLNSAGGSATVKLTRTIPVYSASAAPPELKAQVKVSDENGNEYSLIEKGNGVYEKTGIPIDEHQRYSLFIQTVTNEQYISESVPVKISPKIDSVFWIPGNDGIRFYLNTKDDNNDTRYYRWEATETYEYRSAYGSIYKLRNGRPIPRPVDEQINLCWRTIPPTNILISSSIATNDDVIDNFELNFIPKGSIKLSQRYSLLVRQFAVTEKAFDYWRELEQSTEKVGGLFDPMPSQITGNIRNVSNPQKAALGYFSAGTFSEKRIFVSFYDLPNNLQEYATGCTMDTIPARELSNYSDNTLIIGSYGDPMPIGYMTAKSSCIDCRLHGGTTTKPSFWK